MHVDFCNNLNQEKIHNISSQLNTYPQSQVTIDFVTHELKVVFQNSAEINFPERIARKHLSKNNAGNKPWFGQKCHQARKDYLKAKINYSKNKNSQNSLSLKLATKQYKRTMHFFIKKEKHDKSQKLRAMTTKKPKHYWKYLNSLKPKGKPTEPISLDDLYNYFKQMNSNDVEDERFSNNGYNYAKSKHFKSKYVSKFRNYGTRNKLLHK